MSFSAAIVAVPPPAKRQRQQPTTYPSTSWQCQHCLFLNPSNTSTRCRSCDIRSVVVVPAHSVPHATDSTLGSVDLSDSDDDEGQTEDNSHNASHDDDDAQTVFPLGALPPGMLSSILSFVFDPRNALTLSLVSHCWYELVEADILWGGSLQRALDLDKQRISQKRRGAYVIVDLSCPAGVMRARSASEGHACRTRKAQWTCGTCGLLQSGTGGDSCEFCGADNAESSAVGVVSHVARHIRRQSFDSTTRTTTPTPSRRRSNVTSSGVKQPSSIERIFEQKVGRLGPCMRVLLTYDPTVDVDMQRHAPKHDGSGVRFTTLFHTKLIRTQQVLSDRFGHLSRGWVWVRRALALLFAVGTLTQRSQVETSNTADDEDDDAEDKAVAVVRSLILKLLRQDAAGVRHALRVELALYAEAMRRDTVAAVHMNVVEVHLSPSGDNNRKRRRDAKGEADRLEQQHAPEYQPAECNAVNPEEWEGQRYDSHETTYQRHIRIEPAPACRLAPTVHESRRFLDLLAQEWDSFNAWSSLVNALFHPVLEVERDDRLMGRWHRRTVAAVAARAFRMHVILSPLLARRLNASLACLAFAPETDRDTAETALDIVDLVFARGLSGSTLHDAMRPIAQYDLKLSQVGTHDVEIVGEVLRMGNEVRLMCGDDTERDESADGAYDCDTCDATADRHNPALNAHNDNNISHRSSQGEVSEDAACRCGGRYAHTTNTPRVSEMQSQLVPQCKQLRRALLVLPYLFVQRYQNNIAGK